ncbi:MAG TPA: class I SAM-dependent methyltransferase [Spirochaetia bacterium]|nr:class I SAM-dependent methyltransferase [Spirochaetia bacterium]
MNKSDQSSRREGPMDRQFANPSGPLGFLVGAAMAIEHRALHKAVVERLSLDATDRVLEIGFGSGNAIKLASGHASFVAGIETSREMVAQATRRNRPAIRARKVEILRASAQAIPFPNDCFSVVFEVNSFHHWQNPGAGLAEISRVLRRGGLLLMVLRQGHSGSVMLEAQAASEILERVGFSEIRIERHSYGHGGAFLSARR